MHVVLLREANVKDVEIPQEVVQTHPEGGAKRITHLVIVVLADDARRLGFASRSGAACRLTGRLHLHPHLAVGGSRL